MTEEKTELRMTEVEMARMELHEARANGQLAIVEKLQLAEKLLGIDYREKVAANRAKQADAQRSMTEAQEEGRAVIAGLEKRLGIKFDDYVLQDSGELKHREEITGPPEEDETDKTT